MTDQKKDRTELSDKTDIKTEKPENSGQDTNIFLRDNDDFLSFSHFRKNVVSRMKRMGHWLNMHNRTVWPLALIACLIIVIVIGVQLNEKKTGPQADKNVVASSASSAVESTAKAESIPVTKQALAACTDQKLNSLMVEYYKVLASGDTSKISTLADPVTDTTLKKIKAISTYVDSYPAINVYIKPGPVSGSYLAYVYTEVQMTGYNQHVPGLATYYICSKPDGSYYINMTEDLPDNVASYIHAVDVEEDVIDLNNKVTEEFNNLLADDATFAAYYTKISGEISSSVGTAMTGGMAETAASSETGAAAQASSAQSSTTAGKDSTAASSTGKTDSTGKTNSTTAATGKKVEATDVVNLRSSDSEVADKVGKAQIGDVFTLLEKKDNGWSKVSSDGKEVYIKTQYLKDADSTADTSKSSSKADTSKTTDTSKTDKSTASKSSKTLGSDGYVYASTTINIRKSCSENGDKITTVYKGTKMKLVMNQADGWCKVKYDGQTGYVKSEYLE